jgi:hypothetical protein
MDNKDDDGRPAGYVALTLLWISTSSIPAILLSAEPLLAQRMLLVSQGVVNCPARTRLEATLYHAVGNGVSGHPAGSACN